MIKRPETDKNQNNPRRLKIVFTKITKIQTIIFGRYKQRPRERIKPSAWSLLFYFLCLFTVCSANWNLTLSQFEILFLYYFLTPSAFVAFGTLQVPSRSHMHRIKCLRISRHDLVTAIFALVSTHTDLKL